MLDLFTRLLDLFAAPKRDLFTFTVLVLIGQMASLAALFLLARSKLLDSLVEKWATAVARFVDALLPPPEQKKNH